MTARFRPLGLVLTVAAGLCAAPSGAQNAFGVGGNTGGGQQPLIIPGTGMGGNVDPNAGGGGMLDPNAGGGMGGGGMVDPNAGGGMGGGLAGGGGQVPGFGPITPQPQPAPQPQPPQQQQNPELVDYGVPPQPTLHDGAPHAPTPNSIPGGQVITTVGVQALESGQYGPFVILDILGGQQGLPQAIRATPASQGGNFQDQMQQQFGQFLQQVTQGKKDMPIVLYCLSTECWMSYNAALRAINLGYQNVLWYRGGIEAWQANGGQLTQLP
jgi:PQQ-dependent catabolism-associated CXXCW motif protein